MVVVTVLGEIDENDLGKTLMHEHVFIDFTCVFSEPTEASLRKRAYEKVSLENLGWIRYHPLNNLDNLLLDDEKVCARGAPRVQGFWWGNDC